jgi:hypothetical protein
MVAAPVIPELLPLIGRAVAMVGGIVTGKTISDAMDKTRTDDCASAENALDCQRCKLRDGTISQPKEPRYITSGNLTNYDYQLYIANLHAAPERFFYVKRGDGANEQQHLGFLWLRELAKLGDKGGGYTTLEWQYNGVNFDGFWRSRCTVVEAKGHFAHFFEKKVPWRRSVTRDWEQQMTRQQEAIAIAKPQARLEWYFNEQDTYEAAIASGIPFDIARCLPYMGEL